MKPAPSCGAFIGIAFVARAWKKWRPRKRTVRNDFQVEPVPSWTDLDVERQSQRAELSAATPGQRL